MRGPATGPPFCLGSGLRGRFFRTPRLHPGRVQAQADVMAQSVKIEVEAREPAKNKGTGTRAARRLRARGRIPAIIYGHKQDPVPVSLSRESVWEMIKRSTHLAELDLGGTTETVLVKDV